MGYQKDDLMPGTILKNKYTIQEKLGQGGFGITYKAICDGRVYAIKEMFYRNLQSRDLHTSQVYLTDQSQKKTFSKIKRSFMKEARILSRFQKEAGIINLIDVFEENGTAYMVMDFVEGVTLKEWIENHGEMTPPVLMKKMMPLMKILEKLHDRGVLHRDISPENIIVNRQEEFVLIDFGASRVVEEETSLTTLFKEGYSPIEQYGNEQRQGPWSDIYALFCTMYYAMTSVKPITSVVRLMIDDMKTPGELGVMIEPALESILMKGMAVDYSQRYQNLGEVMQDLATIQGFEKVSMRRLPFGIKILCGATLLALLMLPVLSIHREKTEKYDEEEAVNHLIRGTLTEKELNQIVEDTVKKEAFTPEEFLLDTYVSTNNSNINYQRASLNLDYKNSFQTLCEKINEKASSYILWKGLYLPLRENDVTGMSAEEITQLIYELCARMQCEFYEEDIYAPKEDVFSYEAYTDFDTIDYNQDAPVFISNIGFLVNHLKNEFDITFDPYPLLGYKIEKKNTAGDRFPYASYWYLTDSDLENLSYEELQEAKYVLWNQANQQFDVTDLRFLQEDLQKKFLQKPGYQLQKGSRFALTTMFLSYMPEGSDCCQSYLLPYSVVKYNLRLITKHMIKKGPHNIPLYFMGMQGKDLIHDRMTADDMEGKTLFQKLILAQEINLENNLLFTNSYRSFQKTGESYVLTGEYGLASEIADSLLCEVDYQTYFKENLYSLYQNTFPYRIDWNFIDNSNMIYNFQMLTEGREARGAVSLVTKNQIYTAK